MKLTAFASRHARKRGRYSLLLPTVFAFALGSPAQAQPAAHPDGVAGPPQVVPSRSSSEQVSGLAAVRFGQYADNLYWTHNDINEFGDSQSLVYRTSKDSAPGDEDWILKRVHGGDLDFGALTFAKIGTKRYGFVVVNNTSNNPVTSEIYRFPLSGTDGNGKLIATSPGYIGRGDLVTNGSSLFWADQTGLRAVSTRGGSVTTLGVAQGIAKVAALGDWVYFASGHHIRRVSTETNQIFSVATTRSFVTALFLRSTNVSTRVFWGERDGAVRSVLAGRTAVVTYRGPASDASVRSVSSDGTRVMWINCTDGNICAVYQSAAGHMTRIASQQVGAHDLQTDLTRVFWAADGVLRYTR
jgi:hypothetical protein